MRLYSRIAIAALASALSAAGAAAADAIAVPVTSSPTAVPVSGGSDFDWGGFYAGIFGAAQMSPDWDTQLGVGINAGVNAQFDFFLVGAEVALQGLTGDILDTTYGQVMGRAGLVITDDVLLYATAGYGMDLGASAEEDILLGAGVELAVNQDFTVRAQYLHGVAVTGGNPKEQVTLGASFHF